MPAAAEPKSSPEASEEEGPPGGGGGGGSRDEPRRDRERQQQPARGVIGVLQVMGRVAVGLARRSVDTTHTYHPPHRLLR